MTRNIIAIAFAAASFAAAAPAAAEEAPFRVAVSTAGLDLATPGGRRELAARANAASYGVCGPVLTFHRSDELIAHGCRSEIRARVKAAAIRRALGGTQQLASR